MTSIGLQWLELKVPEFANLSEIEKSAIFDFSILWSFFEGTKLNGKANVLTIKSFVNNLDIDSLESLDISEYLTYLRQRYFHNSTFTQRYEALHLERSGNPPEVEQMLRGCSCTQSEVNLKGCLIIIYRLRNNLFHGDKWNYNLVDQETNFSKASKFLMNLMD